MGGCALLLVLVIGAVWLVGSLVAGSGEPSTAAGPSATASPAPAVDEADVVLAGALATQGIELTSELRAQLKVGCQLLDDGTDVETVALALFGNTDLELEQAGYAVGAGVVAYCPEHRGLFE